MRDTASASLRRQSRAEQGGGGEESAGGADGGAVRGGEGRRRASRSCFQALTARRLEADDAFQPQPPPSYDSWL